MTLVQISGNRSPSSVPLRTEAAMTSDKLFSLGMIAALIGSIGLGAYLWLGLNSQLSLPQNYLSLRATHGTLQIHFFMGAFILGFLLQGAPRILESRKPPLSGARYIFPMLAVALILRLLSFNVISQYLTLVTYCAALICLAPVFLTSIPEKRVSMALPAAFGLGVLSGGTFLNISLNNSALALFWYGIVPVILGIGQQFISRILGGRILTTKTAVLLYLLLLVSGIPLVADLDLSWWNIFAGGSLLTFLVYIVRTGLLVGLKNSEPFCRGFLIAWAWAIVGGLIALTGPQTVDAVLHLWGVGFAMTLIIAVSSRVVSHVTDEEVLPRNVFYTLLGLWQLVPIGRGLRYILPLPTWFSWIVSGVALFVLVFWIVRIVRSLFLMIRRLRAERQTKLAA